MMNQRTANQLDDIIDQIIIDEQLRIEYNNLQKEKFESGIISKEEYKQRNWIKYRGGESQILKHCNNDKDIAAARIEMIAKHLHLGTHIVAYDYPTYGKYPTIWWTESTVEFKAYGGFAQTFNDQNRWNIDNSYHSKKIRVLTRWNIALIIVLTLVGAVEGYFLYESYNRESNHYDAVEAHYTLPIKYDSLLKAHEKEHALYKNYADKYQARLDSLHKASRRNLATAKEQGVIAEQEAKKSIYLRAEMIKMNEKIDSLQNLLESRK